MRFVFGLLLLAPAWMSLTLLGVSPAVAFSGLETPPAQSLIQKSKIVCGDFGNGYTCRSEPGAIRRGKMRKIPGSRSDDSGSGGWFGSDSDDDPDALPPASGDTGAGAPPATTATNCPANSELLGGHCIPYTQRCTASIPPSAAPPLCRGEEKQVCNFHPDGSKDCCCRTYSKF